MRRSIFGGTSLLAVLGLVLLNLNASLARADGPGDALQRFTRAEMYETYLESQLALVRQRIEESKQDARRDQWAGRMPSAGALSFRLGMIRFKYRIYYEIDRAIRAKLAASAGSSIQQRLHIVDDELRKARARLANETESNAGCLSTVLMLIRTRSSLVMEAAGVHGR